MTRRQERVGSLIRRILAEELQRRIVDPRLERMTTITKVEVSSDLSVAKVFVSVMATPAKRKLSLQALRSASGRLRHAVGEQFQARIVPELIFKLDESMQKAAETIALIDRTMADSPQQAPRPTDEVRAADDGEAGDGAGGDDEEFEEDDETTDVGDDTEEERT